MIKTTVDAIVGIIKDGELKNNYEDSNLGIAGTHTESMRFSRERDAKVLNISDSTIDSERPVYGFLANPDDIIDLNSDTGLNKYGDIIIQFKPEAKDNATASLDDSLSPTAYYNQKASPINDAYYEDSKPLNANNYKNSFNGSPPYIEWQSGGKLYLDDIEFIHIPLTVWNQLPKETQFLIALNIHIQFLPS